MPTLRYATPLDAPLVTAHRHRMFADNNFASDAALTLTDAAFEPWVRQRIQDGRYVGLFLEDEQRVLAGAGIFYADFPPHYMDPQPLRAYILNVYTAPEARGSGLARQLMQAVLDECRNHKVATVVLHASPQGRPMYEKMGFHGTNEMLLRLQV